MRNLIRREDGVTAIEYALIAALIAIAIVAAVTLVGGNVAATFTQVANAI
jgi:pilus assembly protein Flp/PilA